MLDVLTPPAAFALELAMTAPEGEMMTTGWEWMPMVEESDEALSLAARSFVKGGLPSVAIDAWALAKALQPEFPGRSIDELIAAVQQERQALVLRSS